MVYIAFLDCLPDSFAAVCRELIRVRWLLSRVLQLLETFASEAAAAAAAAVQDVGGFEMQVLQGAESLLAKHNVSYVAAKCAFGGEARQREILK
jgi:hypothetical protein